MADRCPHGMLAGLCVVAGCRNVEKRRLVQPRTRKRAEVEARRAEVAQLRRQGLSMRQIAARLGVSLGTIASDMRACPHCGGTGEVAAWVPVYPALPSGPKQVETVACGECARRQIRR